MLRKYTCFSLLCNSFKITIKFEELIDAEYRIYVSDKWLYVHLFGGKPLSEPTLAYRVWDHVSVKFDKKQQHSCAFSMKYIRYNDGTIICTKV